MFYKLAFATLAVLIGNDFANAQQIPPTTTAAELWNPWTWFWPYAIATAEGYRDYFQKAQKATNELYQQVYKTNAFPWVTGNWGLPQVNPGVGGEQNSQGGGSGQNSQSGGNGQSNQGNSNQSGSKPTDENKPTQATNGTQVQGDVSGSGTENTEVKGTA